MQKTRRVQLEAPGFFLAAGRALRLQGERSASAQLQPSTHSRVGASQSIHSVKSAVPAGCGSILPEGSSVRVK